MQETEQETPNAPATIDDYIALFPLDVQQILRNIRAVIRSAAPDAEERIGYQMPGFYQNGGLVWFGAHKHHIGLYPTPGGLTAFEEELAAYKGSKGSVHFPLDQPIPYELIAKIVEHRVAENMQKKKKPRKQT